MVENNPLSRQALTALFEREGLRVLAFADGSTFLAAAKTIEPTCVLLDMYLPGHSGLEVLQTLGGATNPAPIITMSARGEIPLPFPQLSRVPTTSSRSP